MNLKLSNRPVRTRMPGGVAGVQPMKAAPYADNDAIQVLASSGDRCSATAAKGWAGCLQSQDIFDLIQSYLF